MTVKLTVPSILCEGCVETVTKAIQSVDAQASVRVDLATKEVSIETIASLADLTAAIDEVGHEVSPT
jgi:copper chaperone